MLTTKHSEKYFYICPKIIVTLKTKPEFNPKNIITDASELEIGKDYYTATNKDTLEQIYHFNNNIPIENWVSTQDFWNYKSFNITNNNYSSVDRGYLISTLYLKTTIHKGNFYIATFQEYLNTCDATETSFLQTWWQRNVGGDFNRKIIVSTDKSIRIQTLFYPYSNKFNNINFSFIK